MKATFIRSRFSPRLPSAGVGALLALLLCRTELSVIALIGIILLIGIVKKNAIMMIDFALEAERTEGKSPKDAIFQACLLRFRPIMMTTMAALLGRAAAGAGTGVGSELRRPLGIAIVGGLIFSQMLTLYTTPVVYLYLDRRRLWFKRRRETAGKTHHAGGGLAGGNHLFAKPLQKKRDAFERFERLEPFELFMRRETIGRDKTCVT